MHSLIQIRFGYTSLTARFYPEPHPNYKLHLGVNFSIMGALFKYLVTYLMMTRVQIGTGSKYWTQCVTGDDWAVNIITFQHEHVVNLCNRKRILACCLRSLIWCIHKHNMLLGNVKCCCYIIPLTECIYLNTPLFQSVYACI